MHAKRGIVKLAFFIVFSKNVTFSNEFKHSHIVYHWKSCFATIHNTRSYLKIRLRLARINCQSFTHCMEMCAVNLGIFIPNGRYQYDEEAKANQFTPKDGGGGGRRRRFVVALLRPPQAQSIVAMDGSSATRELPSPY